MIPEREVKKDKIQPKEKTGSFAIFDIEHFIRRVLKNWYWFVMMLMIGYGIAYVYGKYYAQNIFSSSLSLSVSNNTAS